MDETSPSFSPLLSRRVTRTLLCTESHSVGGTESRPAPGVTGSIEAGWLLLEAAGQTLASLCPRVAVHGGPWPADMVHPPA
jgi:hypothetical protein